jgi:hypothetical protein
MSNFEVSWPSGDKNARRAFLPLVLLAVAFLAWTVFQTVELATDRSALSQEHTQQTSAVAQAVKIRQAADSLATKTKALADSGNPNAQLVMSELNQRGVTVNPNASTPTPP